MANSFAIVIHWRHLSLRQNDEYETIDRNFSFHLQLDVLDKLQYGTFGVRPPNLLVSNSIETDRLKVNTT